MITLRTCEVCYNLSSRNGGCKLSIKFLYHLLVTCALITLHMDSIKCGVISKSYTSQIVNDSESDNASDISRIGNTETDVHKINYAPVSPRDIEIQMEEDKEGKLRISNLENLNTGGNKLNINLTINRYNDERKYTETTRIKPRGISKNVANESRHRHPHDRNLADPRLRGRPIRSIDGLSSSQNHRSRYTAQSDRDDYERTPRNNEYRNVKHSSRNDYRRNTPRDDYIANTKHTQAPVDDYLEIKPTRYYRQAK